MKIRLLLTLVAILTITGQLFIPQSNLGVVWKFVFHVADGILLVSALMMLLFSFFQVGTTANGELCYNPNNPYWKFMGWYCNKFLNIWSNPFSSKISLCKAFWLTVSACVFLILFLTIAGILLSFAWTAYLKLDLLKLFLYTLVFVVGAIGVIGGTIGLIIGGEKLGKRFRATIENKPKVQKAIDKVESIIYIGGIVFILVIGPIIMIMNAAHVGIYQAVIYYFIGVFGIVLTISGAWGLIWLFFKYLPRTFSNTVFGQFLVTKKKQFCPILTACNKY